MIVIVESNFVLELAFQQEQAESCTRLLELAGRREIQLVIPACALFEPYETLVRRVQNRERVAEDLEKELQQLARSVTYADLALTLRSIKTRLIGSGGQYGESLARTVEQIVQVATVVPLNADAMKRSLAAQASYRMPPQDSVIFASVEQYLSEQGDGPKVFANKNERDFDCAMLRARLADFNCRLILSFSDACDYIENLLAKNSVECVSQ